MFLFSTLISQIVMTTMSEFPTAMGMMMVENIPFMHIIAQVAVQAQGEGRETFSTVFVTFAISTIVVGVAFYLLGAFKVGNAVTTKPTSLQQPSNICLDAMNTIVHEPGSAERCKVMQRFA